MLFYVALFLLFHSNTACSQVIEVTVYEQTSGLANWSQHHHRESEQSVLSECERIQSDSPLNSHGNFFSLIRTTVCSKAWAVPGPVGLWCWWNPTWPGPDQALAACRVTSAQGLSLPLCSYLASSSPQRYFPIPLSRGLSLLASSCHARTLFAFCFCHRLNLSIYVFLAFSPLLLCWNQHYCITFIWLFSSKLTYSANHIGAESQNNWQCIPFKQITKHMFSATVFRHQVSDSLSSSSTLFTHWEWASTVVNNNMLSKQAATGSKGDLFYFWFLSFTLKQD